MGQDILWIVLVDSGLGIILAWKIAGNVAGFPPFAFKIQARGGRFFLPLTLYCFIYVPFYAGAEIFRFEWPHGLRRSRIPGRIGPTAYKLMPTKGG
jgi:hypothetical protein